jgi:tRNA pseudouridine38-40 synthase
MGLVIDCLYSLASCFLCVSICIIKKYQGKQTTVQGELERCIARRAQRLVRVVGASRTDAGVHARGQMAHFDLPVESAPHDLSKFEFTLNRMLPSDIRVRKVEAAPTAFCQKNRREEHLGKPWHAIYCAKGKLYSYRISTGLTYDPLERQCRHYEWRSVQHGFDADAFRRAVQVFVGSHDFTSFTNAAPGQTVGADNPLMRNPVRTVERASVMDEGGGRFRVDFLLSGALYRMVRNMVGAALEVGCGLLTVDDVTRILQARDRHGAPRSAPACGLCLEHVFYDE